MLELSTVNDVRPGAPPQEPRFHQLLVKAYGEDVYKKSLVFCSGMDMVNINMLNVVFKDVKTKEVHNNFSICGQIFKISFFP